jgi:hypothetical protein
MSKTTATATTPITNARPVYIPPPRIDTDAMPILDYAAYDGPRFMEVFAHAVSRARAFGSISEARFVAWLAGQVPTTLIDGAGNIHVDLRTAREHRSMFTAHTDTVHDRGGPNVVRMDGDFWRADKGEPLGADDAAGIAVLYNMIAHSIPGYYVFFRGEERGGLGSSWLADNMPSLFKEIDRAVAFDRAGYADVITHQRGGRCCSDEFADALANELSSELDWFLPDATGVYTDTAEFIGLIPECTNISVGYKHQHGDREQQDIAFLQRLANTVLTVAWDALPVARVPRSQDPVKLTPATGYDTSFTTWDEEDSVSFVDALENALYCDSAEDLIDMIAASDYPDQPAIARAHIDATKLTDELLEETLTWLSYNHDPEVLLQSLADACINVQ